MIPPRRNRKVAIEYDRKMYQWRHLVENFFAQNQGVPPDCPRYDKTDASFAATICLADTMLALQ